MPYPELLSVNDLKKLKPSPDEVTVELLRKVYSSKTLYDRLDNLIDLYDRCDQMTSPYKDVAKNIIDIIGHILNEKDSIEIKNKIAARKVIKEFDPAYIPWARPDVKAPVSNDPYAFYQQHQSSTKEEIQQAFEYFFSSIKVNGDLLQYGGKDPETVPLRHTYKKYTNEELEAFRVIPNNWLLTQLKINKSGDNQRLYFIDLDTSSLTIKAVTSFSRVEFDLDQRGLYTLHINGSIFVGCGVAFERTSFFGHSEPIFHPSYGQDEIHDLNPSMAGQIQGFHGVIFEIDAASGHYQPDYEQTMRAMNFFKQLGLINNLTLTPYFMPTKDGRKYTSEKYTEIECYVRDQLEMHEIDSRVMQTPALLQEYLPEVYAKYSLQTAINKEFHIWLQESSTWGTPSKAAQDLNDTVRRFSQLGKYDDPLHTKLLLEKILMAIEGWRNFHAASKKTSRRTPAVNNLETRTYQHLVTVKLQELVSKTLKKETNQPSQLLKILTDFASYNADLTMTAEALSALKLAGKKTGFFSQETNPPGFIHLVNFILDATNNDTKALSHINEQLDDLIKTNKLINY